MAHLQRILCPTDFSECAGQAFAQTLLLAQQLDAELHTLHAIVLHDSDPKIEADLIVVGSQGHSPLEDLMLGSTAEGIVRRASCPVLTVKAPSFATH